MPRLNITAIAARCGVHKSTVSRQCRAAGLVGEDGLVELDDYRALRATSLDPALQTSGPEAARPAASTLRAPPDPDAPDLAEQRARKMAADAQLAEIALARQRGQLLDKEAVERAQEDRARSLRQRILAEARAIAPVLAQLDDASSIAAHLTLAMERALKDEHDALRGAA